jgi:hypothetical protein
MKSEPGLSRREADDLISMMGDDEEKDGGGAKVGTAWIEEIRGKGRRQAAALDSKILFS